MTGMDSLILRTATRFMMPLLLLFSLFVLLRGHDEPGGGFIAGLIAAGAFVLYLFAFGIPATQRLLRVDPHDLFGIGLVIATLAAVPAIFLGQPFFTAQWWELDIAVIGEVKLSTPLIFDIGVYLTVLGSVLTIVMALSEAQE